MGGAAAVVALGGVESAVVARVAVEIGEVASALAMHTRRRLKEKAMVEEVDARAAVHGRGLRAAEVKAAVAAAVAAKAVVAKMLVVAAAVLGVAAVESAVAALFQPSVSAVTSAPRAL